jgi:Fungal specific transcription factor domain
MIAIDGSHNDWRSLVLPSSLTDPLVMQAVISVSTSHIDLNWHSPNRTYARSLFSFFANSNTFHQHMTSMNPIFALNNVVSSLRKQCDLDMRSVEQRHSILITILVLLVGVMVNGRSDFPIILRMLESATMALGGEQKLGTAPVADFIRFQARKHVQPYYSLMYGA